MNLRDLPKVDALARVSELAPYPERVRVEAARRAIDRLRSDVLVGADPSVTAEGLALEIAESLAASSLRGAINLSGVVLHTGLGRARLAEAAVRKIAGVAGGYSTLEFDLETGERGDRQEHVRELLRQLTGAEDALVLNNAAGAVTAALAALAHGREVILSRGQMVEIGGSFRMPDIVRESGCRLVEVGCTNRTHASDYESAISDATAAILRCHPSNYRIVGFTEEPSLEELRRIARARGIRLIDDQGSGCLFDLRTLGLPAQTTLPESAHLADVAIASGDKLIGGPQAGIVVGRSEVVSRIRRHPLARAMRIDKLCLAGLEATLRLWTNGQEEEIPTIAYLRRPLEAVRELAETLAEAWPQAVVEPGETEVGSGSAPGVGIPTFRVGLPGEVEFARQLRTGAVPIVGRLEKGRLWLDPRTLEAREVSGVVARLRELAR